MKMKAFRMIAVSKRALKPGGEENRRCERKGTWGLYFMEELPTLLKLGEIFSHFNKGSMLFDIHTSCENF